MLKFIQKTAEPGSARGLILKQYYAQHRLLFTAKSGVFHQGLWSKFIFLMRCSFIMLVIQITFAGVLVASTAKSQNINEVNVALNLKEATVKESLIQLQAKSGIKFTLFSQLLDREHKKVTLATAQMSVRDALANILSGTNLRYKLVNEFIVIEARPVPPPPGRISGKIVDDKGESLPGASIKVVETGVGAQSDVDGSYMLVVQPGTYTLEITYISFQTQRITGVVVTEDKNTLLNVALKPDASGLQEVVVTASYSKASTQGLLARQKNASEISNGISAEQLSRTPDKNIGESLKRISGVSTIDNKFVLVRGIGERYNSAMLDGTVLPSTEAQSRNFSFDLIPSNIVDNVVVSKTVTPDMNASFGGGLVQIVTKDIPNEDFMSFSAGASYNHQATGKDFISHKRGKYDYFGFDDGRRDFPKDVVITNGLTPEQIEEQSKRFTNDNFTVHTSKAAPSQNYQFTLGRLLTLDTASNNKLGFTGSLSYRNTQSNAIISQQTRGDWSQGFTNTGNAYGFNTTLGGILNVGLQLGTNRFSFRNTYTHLYDNTLYRTVGWSTASEDPDSGLPPTRIQETDDPTYTDLLQNKLSGQHPLGKVKLEWDLARTSVSRQEKDLVLAESSPELIGTDYVYYFVPTYDSEPRIDPMSRHHYQNKEQHYSWNLAATLPFTIGQIRSSVKAGYFGNQKKGDFDWTIAAITKSWSIPDSMRYIPISEVVNPGNMGPDGFQYTITGHFRDSFHGKSQTHAGFIMFDNRLMEKLRLVWGIRGEYYEYTEGRNPSNGGNNVSVFTLKPDLHWQWLPSANLTYSPFSSLNIRTAYSSSVVRPELSDNSQFWRYNPTLGGQFGNQGLYSTRINSVDLKIEWFPGVGEILSVGGFYKKFDKPTETVVTPQGNTTVYYLKSAVWAKVYGLEFELRKNLGFIMDNVILNSLTAYGNLTLQKSEVRSTYQVSNPDPAGPPSLEATSKQSRPMYGQTPYLINAGLQYTGSHLGFNVMYNKSGFKTYLANEDATRVEYERPRELVDAQISYRFMKNKFEIRLNASNLLNSASTFYRNTASYEPNPDAPGGLDYSNALRLKPGFTDKYEEGDRIMFSQKFGRTYSTTLTWNF